MTSDSEGMESLSTRVCEVLVIGSGLGGLRAASELASAGRKTLLVSAGPFCSGASFCPWTWGLGMVAPRSDAERQALFDEIGSVGLGLNEAPLTRRLVERVSGEIEWLVRQGVVLRPATEAEGVIPCFGSFRLAWHGFEFPSARRAFEAFKALPELEIIDNYTITDLFKAAPGDMAALGFDAEGSPVLVAAKAIIVASGGFTSLFSRNFLAEPLPVARTVQTPSAGDAGAAFSIAATGQVPLHAAAASLGCRMKNMEFVQFIPAHTEPAGRSIFNERAFSRVRFEDSRGNSLFGDADRPLLEMRAAHGPFTTRLPDRVLDEAIFSHYRQTGRPVSVLYPADIDAEPDTLLRAYFQWFRRKFSDGMPGRIGIVHYAHACNGGISIDERGAAGVDGLFACGEVTGGIHGADRIGGLSTGGALVFGALAGRSAAEYCKALGNASVPVSESKACAEAAESAFGQQVSRGNRSGPAFGEESPGPDPAGSLREMVYRHASIVRDAEGLAALEKALDRFESMIGAGIGSRSGRGTPAFLGDERKKRAVAGTLRLFIGAINARPNPAGCHNFVGKIPSGGNS